MDRWYLPRTALPLKTLVAVAALVVVPIAGAHTQAPTARATLLKVEVRDGVGLPLPDARVEVFLFPDGGTFWEWMPVEASQLPEGINLLRFSAPGFHPTILSVPLRSDGVVSLRVNLEPERDTTVRAEPEAHVVRAIGLALEGKARTDVIGHRRVLERRAIEALDTDVFGPLMHRVRGTELNVTPVSGGTFRVFSQSAGGGTRCPVEVMLNGDRRRIMPFETFDRLFGTTQAEVIEIFPRGGSVPLAYRVSQSRCGLLVVWLAS